MKRIGVLTSGGDAPGMNAVIRSVVRTAFYNNIEVMGIKRGYLGLVKDEIEPFSISSVGDIIHRGGTVLHSARCEEFLTKEGRITAWDNIEKNGIEGLIVIGGNGSLKGADVFTREFPINIIGIPGTIDNDIPGTDYSIGFDTCVNTVVGAIHRIRDTVTSHDRISVIEVMGRHAGFIALEAGLAGGAESILIPEKSINIEEICQKIIRGINRGKKHSIIIIAEGANNENADIASEINRRIGLETRVTILGHLQRGGAPTAFDSVLGSKMGAKAVELLQKGYKSSMVGIVAGKIISIEFEQVLNNKKNIDFNTYELANVLSI